MKLFLFALIAAMGNAIYVYGQRSAETSDNPFFFLLATLMVCTTLYFLFAITNSGPMEMSYLHSNIKSIVLSGVGFFITFIGFYYLYTQQGASTYMVYALLSILTTTVGVGMIIFREPFNKFHIISALLAVCAILCYGYAQHKLNS